MVTEDQSGGVRIQPTAAGDEEIRFFALYLRRAGRWQLADVGGATVVFALPSRPEAWAVTAIDLAGNESAPTR